MKLPFPAYDGDEPFVFVSYAHADADLAYKELSFLHEAGINIWYDEGITPGSRWSDELAAAINRADMFLVLLTRAAVASENCLNEIDFALRHGRPFLAVELEPVDLPPGIELNIGNRQSILKHRFQEADYRNRLLEAIRRTSRSQTSKRGASYGHAPALPARRRLRFASREVALLVLGLVIGTVGLYFGLRSEQSPAVDTIAVLPFQNMSSDPGYEYLADGLADELIFALGGQRELSVSSRTSSFYYKNQNPQMQDIRERLGVEHAIEGSIRIEQGALIVNISLFETSQGKQVWSHQFDARLNAVSSLSAEIGLAVAAALGIEDDPSTTHWAQSSQIQSAAYEAFLKGNEFLFRPPKPEVLTAARIHFETALAAEPGFVRAAAALCDTHLAFYRMARTEDVDAHYQSATEHCNEALTLDPTNWSGHHSLATLYRLSGRYEDALSEIRLADTLQPDTAAVQYEYGKILAELNQADQAEQKLREGIALDPGFWGGYADFGDFLFTRGRYQEALVQFEKVHQLTPDNGLVLVSLGAVHYMLEDPVAADTVWRRAISENPDSESRAFWQAATWLGINSLDQHCPEQAAYWQQQAISVSPNDHRLWGRLAESCQQQQDDGSRPLGVTEELYRHAIVLAESELQSNPKDWESLGLLALYRTRISNAAIDGDMISSMLELQPNNPDALEIALLYAVVTNNEQAKNQMSKRLLEQSYPESLLENISNRSRERACAVPANEKERLICSQGKIIPSLPN